MSTPIDLEAVAIQRFHQRWRDKALRHGRGAADMSRLYTEAASISWLLRDLLLLVTEECDKAVREIEPTIRRMVAEHEFVQAADCPGGPDMHHELHDRLVETLIEVLEDVHRLSSCDGQGVRGPASVPMFG